MANRNFTTEKQYSWHVAPVSLDLTVAIGATGAPTIETGYGIDSITRLAAGVYRIHLEDSYNRLLQFNATMQAPVTGLAVAATALVPGTVYQIVTMGTTTQANWETSGVPAGITAAVGVTFLAAATSAGTGTAKALGASGVSTVELISTTPNMLENRAGQAGNGGYIDFKCLGTTMALSAPYTPAGTVAAPVFTGAAMGTHTHVFTGDALATHDHSIPPGTDGAGGTSGATSGGTPAGTNAATSAGTPAGTNSAPAFTGTPATLTGTVTYVTADPADGSKMLVRILLSNSAIQ